MRSPATDGSEPLAFIRTLTLADVPEPTRRHARLLLADLAAVCVAGRAAPASAIAVEHARAIHPGEAATALLDGSRLGVCGAAFANGVLANVLDFDDGHRLTKGHPGAVVIPAALAVAQQVDASCDDLLSAVIVGYEIAIRAGVALHARDDAYHASGAWGAVGAAAAAARLLELDPTATAHALGLAEYHAPIAPIMRSCAEPAMTKDACAWGATLGVQSALLAARGFTSVGSEFLGAPSGVGGPGDGAGAERFADLGTRWALEELYIKAYPCCRWSQGAIAAALELGASARLVPAEIERVVVRTFAAAAGLAQIIPANTEEAQYNLAWPVACALAHGRFNVADTLGPFDDPAVRELFTRVEITVNPELTARFPARRETAVEVQLRDGRRLSAGPREAPGEPEDPGWAALVREKVRALVDPARDLGPGADPRLRVDRASDFDGSGGLGHLGAPALLGLLCAGIEVAVGA